MHGFLGLLNIYHICVSYYHNRMTILPYEMNLKKKNIIFLFQQPPVYPPDYSYEIYIFCVHAFVFLVTYFVFCFGPLVFKWDAFCWIIAQLVSSSLITFIMHICCTDCKVLYWFSCDKWLTSATVWQWRIRPFSIFYELDIWIDLGHSGNKNTVFPILDIKGR